MPALLEKTDKRKDIAAEPFRWFDRMRDEFERVFENNLRMPLAPRADTYWMPALEVFQTNGEFHVNAELPGMTKENVKLEVTPEGLTLTGERNADKIEEREGYYRSERGYGAFCRFVPIPEGADIDKLTARFKDGVLEITVPVPKAAKTIGRVVDIK